MKLYSLILDDFLDQPDELRKYAEKASFKEEISPADGLAYKGVCKTIPLSVELEICTKLSYVLSCPIVPYISFLRLSLENVSTRWIHADIIYSKYVLVVYLNTKFPLGSGTRFFSHPEIDLTIRPLPEKMIELWDAIANKPEKWSVAGEIPMKYNRALIYDTAIFHAPLPKDGFGVTRRDGRVIYCMFFNLR
jgi:hypothetical protein